MPDDDDPSGPVLSLFARQIPVENAPPASARPAESTAGPSLSPTSAATNAPLAERPASSGTGTVAPAGQGFRALTDRWTVERIERLIALLHKGDREELGAWLEADVPRVPHSTDPPGTLDLKGIDFERLGYKVDLGRVHFDRLNLWSSRFVNVNLKGARFTSCAMGQTTISAAYLREVHFKDCDLHGTDFIRSNLLKVRFEKTRLRFSTWVDTEVDMESFSEGLEEEHRERWGLARDVYKSLRLNFNSGGDEKGASWAAYRQSVMQRYDLYSRKEWARWALSWLLDVVWGYGEKPARLFGFAVFFVLTCGTGYFFLGLKTGDTCTTGLQAGSPLSHFFECIYFSFITFTTVGYGDILPCTEGSRLLAMFEAFGGVFLMGLFVTANARKLEGR